MVISKLIKYFWVLRSKFIYLKSVLNENADLVVNGVYKVNSNLTQIYESNYYKCAFSESQYQFDNLYGKRDRKPLLFVKRMISRLTSFKVQTEKKTFRGKLINITSMHGNIKVFDFEKNLILSVFTDVKKLTQIVENRNYWGIYFNVPKFEVHYGDHLFIEEKILKKEHFEDVNMLSSIIDDYINYFQLITLPDRLYLDKVKARRFASLTDLDEKEMISYMLTQDYQECIVHGDLWFSNIIYSDGQKYYIDFENVGQRVFYYDILLYIFTSWKLGDFLLLEMYCDGRLDQELTRLFNGIKISYDPSKKRVFFVTFLFFYYMEFWQDKTKLERRFLELFSRIKNI